MSSVVDAVLERMCTAYQVEDLSALADRLGLDEKTFRVWRTRKSVPDRVLVKASSETGRAVPWLKGGTSGAAYAVQEPSKNFEKKEKQVNVTPEELALLQNYRAASDEGQRMLSAASAALAKPKMKKERAA